MNSRVAPCEPVEPAIGRGDRVVEPAAAVEDRHERQAVPTADLEIVEIVGRGDLDRPRALLGIAVRIGHDRQPAADERQDGIGADQIRVALVMRMHGDA